MYQFILKRSYIQLLCICTTQLFIQGCGGGLSSDSHNFRSPKPNDLQAGGDVLNAAGPTIQGRLYTNYLKPEWQWIPVREMNSSTVFRFSLDDENLKKNGNVSRALSFQPLQDLAPGKHIFYIQEKISDSSWSRVETFETIIDLEAPAAVEFTNSDKRTAEEPLLWNWKKQADIESYLVKLGDADFANGGVTTLVPEFAPTIAEEDKNKDFELFVIGRDLAGNRSPIVSKKITVSTGS